MTISYYLFLQIRMEDQVNVKDGLFQKVPKKFNGDPALFLCCADETTQEGFIAER